MPWYRVTDSQHNSWQLNSDGVARIVRSYIYHRRLLERSRRVFHDSGSWFLPDTVSYDTNFSGIVQYVDSEAGRWMSDAWVQSNLNGNGLFNSLVDLRQQAVRDGETYHRNSMQASHESQQNINRIADMDGSIVTGLQHVRNTSASILIAGATVVSGGTATALVAGAGAGLRFTSRIQEGGTIGQAAAETAVDMTVALITRGAGQSIAAAGAETSAMGMATMAVLTTTLNTGADLAKTVITGEVGRRPLEGFAARIGAETVNGLVASLLTRGIPFLRLVPTSTSTGARDALVSAAFGFVGDRLVDSARGIGAPNNPGTTIPSNTLLAATPGLTSAEAFVRENAMRAAP
jgi:hypothetical protein